MIVADHQPADAVLPRPRLTLNIGITGHRLNKLDFDAVTRVTDRFQSFTTAVDAVIGAVAAEADALFRDGPPLVRIVTALAEGADRIAVLSKPPAWVYEAVLPMPRDDYANDFVKSSDTASLTQFNDMLDSAQSVTELPWPESGDDEQDRAESYRKLGNFLVRQIDVLVAVWDGSPPDGAGGTGDVAACAVASAKPIVWIDIRPDTDIRLVSAIDTSGRPHRDVPLDAEVMRGMLRTLLLPTSPPPPRSAHGAVDQHRSDEAKTGVPNPPAYYNACWPRTLYLPFAYMTLRRLAKAGRWSWPLRYPDFNQQLGSWAPFFAAMPARGDDRLQGSVATLLFPRSIWADTLAWYYGNVYRSAYVSSFLLAGLSVPLGLCYLFFLSLPAVLNIKAGFVILELLIITTVVVLVRRGVKSDWHALWLQTRELSELLRLGRPLTYIGALRDFVPAPEPGEGGSFATWYARATFREIGLPDATLNSAYLKTVLSGTRDTEIREQRSYHASNAINMQRVHHLLHRSGDFCFTATIVFLVIYLVAWGFDWISTVSHAHAGDAQAHGEEAHSLFHEILEYGVKPVVSIAAAGLPALGAALTGIREQGDFEGFAERSIATYQELADCETRIDQLVNGDNLIVDDATTILNETVLVMAKDVTAWKRQYAGKRLALPA